MLKEFRCIAQAPRRRLLTIELWFKAGVIKWSAGIIPSAEVFLAARINFYILYHSLDEEKLRIFERRILRRIYGPTCENGVWRIKYNDELYILYKDLDIVRVIKVARIGWLGHLVRMEEKSPCKKITTSQPEGSRKKGRLKLRWIDSVLKDVKLLKVEAWWKKALDRNIWGRIIKEAKVHKGL
jgi:hypothetical protein